MNKLMIMFLLVMAVCFIGYAQNPTEVPRPTEVPSDYGAYGWQYYDFDGDGSKDVLTIYYKDGVYSRYYTIYSYKKKQTISVILIDDVSHNIFEDLDNDGAPEIFIYTFSNKTLIYEATSAVDTKKKLP